MKNSKITASFIGPRRGSDHVDRGVKIDAQVQKEQATRREKMANRPVVNPSTNALPSLKNAPKVAMAPFLKKQG